MCNQQLNLILSWRSTARWDVSAAMKAVFEAVTPEEGVSWAFLDRRLAGGIPFEWHHHPEYELTLTLNSRGHRYVGDDVEAYDDGDLVLIGPGLPHSWYSREAIDPAEPHVALVAWFTREWATRLTIFAPELGQLSVLLERAARGVVFSEQANRQTAPLIQMMRSADPARRLVLLLEVLRLLCRDDHCVEMTNAVASISDMPAADARMVRALDYLHRHFAERTPLPDLAGIAGVSVSGLHRMFRRHTRMTIVGYVVRLRIGRACSMLIHEKKAIAVIAAEVGYTNLALFNRQFARLKGETPREFRKRHRCMPE